MPEATHVRVSAVCITATHVMPATPHTHTHTHTHKHTHTTVAPAIAASLLLASPSEHSLAYRGHRIGESGATAQGARSIKATDYFTHRAVLVFCCPPTTSAKPGPNSHLSTAVPVYH